MRYAFYDSEEYRERQRKITALNIHKGRYAHLKKRIKRNCERNECHNVFSVQPADPKRFCSRSCSATVKNTARIQTEKARARISRSLAGRAPTIDGQLRKGLIFVPRVEKVCGNTKCNKLFSSERYKNRKYCSSNCAIKTVGSRPTSPKASRGKSGVRSDIHPTISFHSRWEANIARFYNYLNLKWEYEPKTFDIGNHTYTPDFYLPEEDAYIEVKNFWNDYADIRDRGFREKYPDICLEVVLKEEYLSLEKSYAPLIAQWEYKNSPVFQ